MKRTMTVCVLLWNYAWVYQLWYWYCWWNAHSPLSFSALIPSHSDTMLHLHHLCPTLKDIWFQIGNVVKIKFESLHTQFCNEKKMEEQGPSGSDGKKKQPRQRQRFHKGEQRDWKVEVHGFGVKVSPRVILGLRKVNSYHLINLTWSKIHRQVSITCIAIDLFQ